jgi:LysM repeat protein
MARWKRLFYYLLINVLVSACTILSILWAWERFRPLGIETPTPQAFVPAPGVTPDAVQEQPELPPLEEEQIFEDYTIQPGDTLNAIAAAYGVSPELIIEVNEIVNPNTLTIGSVLQIPVGSVVVAAETQAVPTALPDATRTPPALPTQSGTEVSSSEVSLEIVSVIAPGEIEEERVVLRLAGEGTLELQGWQLQGAAGETFTFPLLSLFKDGAVTVYSKPGINSVVELYWGLDEASIFPDQAG